MEISIEPHLKKVAGLEPEGLATLSKKDSNSCFPVKFVKFLRAPDFKEHRRTNDCKSKPLRCMKLPPLVLSWEIHENFKAVVLKEQQ